LESYNDAVAGIPATGTCCRILEHAGEYWRILENAGDWRLLENTLEYWKILEYWRGYYKKSITI
jgi:hypothetical protein